MLDILSYSRNRCTSVEQKDEQTIQSICHLQDTLMDLRVKMTVKLPDLEITDIQGEIFRSPYEEDAQALDFLGKLQGIRVGPGMKKIIKGLMGETGGKSQIAFMAEECGQAVILSFTRDQLNTAPRDEESIRKHFTQMVKDNPRMYNRCAAFAPGSSFTKDMAPE